MLSAEQKNGSPMDHTVRTILHHRARFFNHS